MLQGVDRRTFLGASIGFGLTALCGGHVRALATLAESQSRSSRFEAMLSGYVASGVLSGVAGSLGYGIEQAEFLAAGALSRDSENSGRCRLALPHHVHVEAGHRHGGDDADRGRQDRARSGPRGFRSRLRQPARADRPHPKPGQPALQRQGSRSAICSPTPAAWAISAVSRARCATSTSGSVSSPFRWTASRFPTYQISSTRQTSGQFAERLATLPLLADPGTYWRYSMSPDLLGRVIEIASGRTFEAFLEERIFSPLGMTSTFFTVPKSAKRTG